jgi:osmotically-inducible protein OsmY
MNRNAYHRTLLILAACAAVSACGAYKQTELTNLTDDSTINTNVRAAVAGVPGVYENTAHVSTENGVVNLDAAVQDKLAAQNVVQAARQVAGVKRVDFNLQLQP